jgi:DNA topoisomerase II
MPIWSFTQERLDRLKEAIAKKKAEHDELQALSEKDLWCKDLDEFAETWEQRLKLDAEISTGIRRMSKYRKKTGGRGRKVKEDDDFMPTAARSKPAAKTAPKTAKVVETIVEKKAKPAVKSSLFSKKARTDGADDSDPFSDDDFAALKKEPVKEEEDEDAGPVVARTKRAAATKAKSWIVDDDESEESEDDDKMLDDVGDLVKGVSNTKEESSDAKTSRLSLFPMSRPESSHGDSGAVKVKSKPSKASDFKFDDFDSNDDTNYEMLAKPSPHKNKARNDDLDSFLSDDDDLPPAPKLSSKPKASASAASEEPKPKPKAKATTSASASAPAVKKPRGRPAGTAKKAAAPKTTQLSPAAKTYAAKKSKAKAKKDDFDMEDDDEEDVAMDDPESPPPRPAARGRPGRAAAAKSKPVYVVEDDDDDDSMDDFAMDDSE